MFHFFVALMQQLFRTFFFFPRLQCHLLKDLFSCFFCLAEGCRCRCQTKIEGWGWRRREIDERKGTADQSKQIKSFGCVTCCGALSCEWIHRKRCQRWWDWWPLSTWSLPSHCRSKERRMLLKPCLFARLLQTQTVSRRSLRNQVLPSQSRHAHEFLLVTSFCGVS